jgi:spore germination protein GerM
MKRIIPIIVIVTMLIIAVAGCKSPAGGTNRSGQNNGDTIIKPDPDGQTIELNLYFANREYIQTGNEDLEKLLVEKRQVTATDKNIAEMAVEELIKGPKDNSMAIVIAQRIQLISVEVADNIAYVNFSSSGMNGGSMEETFMVSSIVMTLTEPCKGKQACYQR